MKHSSAAAMVLLAAMLGHGSPAVAHRPMFSDLAATGPDTAIAVHRPEISQVIYRSLTAERPELWLSFRAEAGFPLFIQIGVPVLDRLQAYRPSMAVVGPGLGRAAVPFDLPDGVGVEVFPTGSVQSPQFFHERVTGTDSWILRSETLQLPLDGTYYLVAFDPEGRSGKLWLALGTRERFGPLDLLRLPGWKRMIRTFHEVGTAGSPGKDAETISSEADHR